MGKMDKKLADKFDMAPPVVDVPASVPAIIEPTPVVSVSAVIDSDADKAGETLRTLIDKSMSSLNDLIRVAKDSENPRAYEVVAQMIKATADISKDLVSVHKIKRDAKPVDDETPTRTNIGHQQNIFVGSTNDLLRAIAAAKAPMEIQADATISEPSKTV